MKTAEEYLQAAEAAERLRPWGFLNKRRTALAAIQAAIEDARRPPARRKSPQPAQPGLFA